jgi:hypothetical protein
MDDERFCVANRPLQVSIDDTPFPGGVAFAILLSREPSKVLTCDAIIATLSREHI